MNKQKTIVCRVCQQEKAPEKFRVQSYRKSGRDTMCNSCRAIHRRANGENIQQLVYWHAKRAGQAVPYVSVDDLIDVFEAYTDCPYCAVKLDETNRSIDHVFPMSSEYGGKHIPENIVACCKSCNSSKNGTKTIFDFYQRKDTFTPELFRKFVKTWISRMIDREISEHEVDEMIENLRQESEEQRGVSSA